LLGTPGCRPLFSILINPAARDLVERPSQAAMPAFDQTIRSYSQEELRLLAAEGRLKGRGVERLTRIHPISAQHRVISQAEFEKHCLHTPCWTDPTRLLNSFLALIRRHSPSQGEQPVAEYLMSRLKRMGFDAIQQDHMGNVIARKNASHSPSINLLFTAHMDCVYPGGTAPVSPRFYASGEIRSDGANSLGADDKAGLAAILAALDYIDQADLPHGDIRVVFTVQEELGYRGIKQVPASILNNIHLVISMDPPVRVERDETARMAVLHFPPTHPFFQLARQAASDCGVDPLLLFAEGGYVGGDTICLSPLGAWVIDFCSTSRYPHTHKEHIRIEDLIHQTNWMISTLERVLALDPASLDLRALYGDEPIGALTGVRKQVPLTPDLLAEKRKLAGSLSGRPGPKQVPALIHLSAIAPRIGDPDLLKDVVEAYTQCVRLDHVPQVLRGLLLAMSHLATNLADVRPLEPLLSVAHLVIERGGDDTARITAIDFLAEIFQKARRPALKSRILRIVILCLQSPSPLVINALRQFLKANLDHAIHALTVAFCNLNRTAWERSEIGNRIISRNTRSRETEIRWTTIRQHILQLMLEEDRILPEMLEWIFTHDSGATQKIAVGYIDPSKASRIAGRILQNLKSRQPGVQETAVHFAGTHKMLQAVTSLVDLLLTPYLCRKRSLVEWALDRIGTPAIEEVVTRLGNDIEFAPFVRRLFNAHDQSTEVDFAQLPVKLCATYGPFFSLDDPSQQLLLSHYLGVDATHGRETLTHWDKRRAIIFYNHISRQYPNFHDLEKLAELLEDADGQARGHFAQIAMQKNIFEDPDFLTLVSRENARFLEHLVWLEKQIPLLTVMARLREYTHGAQLDMNQPQDVELYYLYLLKQSPKMPDRTRYLKHIQEARTLLFPPVKPYCSAFTISGDRIEEVGTVDRVRIRTLMDGLPDRESREQRLRDLLGDGHLAKRERHRLINGLAEAYEIDVMPYNTIEARIDAVLQAIDFEFDAAYRPVPQVIFPALMRIRMKHRDDAVVPLLAECAIEYALVNHPEIRDAFDTGETDLLLDNLNDLFTDRVYESERELSEDVFPELKDKHLQSLAQFYSGQWKSIIRDLKKQFTDERAQKLILATEKAMVAYDILDEEESNMLDTNLNRLMQILFSPAIEQARRKIGAAGGKLPDIRLGRLCQVLKIEGADLVAFHDRHRECFKVYTAVLRVRNLRQLKRIYREVYLSLQDEISFAGREHPDQATLHTKHLMTGDPDLDQTERIAALKGYLKYGRKELGKLGKLMSDFAIEGALADAVQTVQNEITKLRQVVIGTSQILCVPSKDVSIIYRSWPGNDCNTGDLKQIMCPDGSFYKIISDGLWKGYFTLVELRNRNTRALLLDVLNFSGLKMENESFIKVLMHQIIQTAQKNGFDYVLSSPIETQISNRDYIRRAFHKSFPALGLVQNFGLTGTPAARFQSLNANLRIAWQSPNIAN
jgi:hypothetical protein